MDSEADQQNTSSLLCRGKRVESESECFATFFAKILQSFNLQSPRSLRPHESLRLDLAQKQVIQVYNHL